MAPPEHPSRDASVKKGSAVKQGRVQRTGAERGKAVPPSLQAALKQEMQNGGGGASILLSQDCGGDKEDGDGVRENPDEEMELVEAESGKELEGDAEGEEEGGSSNVEILENGKEGETKEEGTIKVYKEKKDEGEMLGREENAEEEKVEMKERGGSGEEEDQMEEIDENATVGTEHTREEISNSNGVFKVTPWMLELRLSKRNVLARRTAELTALGCCGVHRGRPCQCLAYFDSAESMKAALLSDIPGLRFITIPVHKAWLTNLPTSADEKQALAAVRSACPTATILHLNTDITGIMQVITVDDDSVQRWCSTEGSSYRRCCTTTFNVLRQALLATGAVEIAGERCPVLSTDEFERQCQLRLYGVCCVRKFINQVTQVLKQPLSAAGVPGGWKVRGTLRCFCLVVSPAYLQTALQALADRRWGDELLLVRRWEEPAFGLLLENLPAEVTDEDIGRMLTGMTTVRVAVLPKYYMAVVYLPSEEERKKCLSLHHTLLKGKQISVRTLDSHVLGLLTLAQSQPITGAAPAQSQSITGAAPSQGRPITGTAPVQSRPITGAAPAQSQPITGMAPAQSQPNTGTTPAQKSSFPRAVDDRAAGRPDEESEGDAEMEENRQGEDENAMASMGNQEEIPNSKGVFLVTPWKVTLLMNKKSVVARRNAELTALGCCGYLQGRPRQCLAYFDSAENMKAALLSSFEDLRLITIPVHKVWLINLPISANQKQALAAVRSACPTATILHLTTDGMGLTQVITVDNDSVQALLVTGAVEIAGERCPVLSTDEFERQCQLRLYGVCCVRTSTRQVRKVLKQPLTEAGVPFGWRVRGSLKCLCLVVSPAHLQTALQALADRRWGDELLLVRRWEEPAFGLLLENLPAEVTNEDIAKLLTGVTTVRVALLPKYRKAIVYLPSEEERKKCLSLHQTQLKGKQICVKILNDQIHTPNKCDVTVRPSFPTRRTSTYTTTSQQSDRREGQRGDFRGWGRGDEYLSEDWNVIGRGRSSFEGLGGHALDTGSFGARAGFSSDQGRSLYGSESRVFVGGSIGNRGSSYGGLRDWDGGSFGARAGFASDQSRSLCRLESRVGFEGENGNRGSSFGGLRDWDTSSFGARAGFARDQSRSLYGYESRGGFGGCSRYSDRGFGDLEGEWRRGGGFGGWGEFGSGREGGSRGFVGTFERYGGYGDDVSGESDRWGGSREFDRGWGSPRMY